MADKDNFSDGLLQTLSGAGAAGAGGWLWRDSAKIDGLLNDWDAAAEKANNAIRNRIATKGVYKSPYTGQALKLTPSEAENLFKVYHDGGHALTNARFLGVKGKDLAKLRFIDLNYKIAERQARIWAADHLGINKGIQGPLHDAIRDLRGQLANNYHHYDMFADPRTSTKHIGSHMLNVIKGSYLVDEPFKDRIKELLANAEKGGPFAAEYDIIASDRVSWEDKLKKLKELADKHGNTELLEQAERLFLGDNNHLRPGVAEFSSGSFRTVGARDGYMTPLRRLARGGKFLGKGLAASGAAIGGLGLMELLRNSQPGSVTKTASAVEEGPNYLQAGTGGAAFAYGANDTKNLLVDAIRAIRNKRNGGESLETWLDAFINPNRTVGVTYGDWDAIGDGHKSPGNNIAKILRDAIKQHPKGSAEGSIIVKELPRHVQGLDRDMIRRNYNMLYNTGLGMATHGTVGKDTNGTLGLDAQGRGVPEGFYDNPKLSEAGRVQSLRNYMTDHATRYKNGDGKGGPTYDTTHVLGKAPGDVKLITYGTDDLRDYPDRHIYKDVLHLGNNPGGSPLLDTAYMDSIEKFNTREKMLAELERYASGEVGNLDAVDRPKLKKIIDSVRAGNPLVTIAGSGRGDYVPERALSILSSADRHGYGAGKISIVPLMATHVDEGADKAEKFKNTLKFREAFDTLDPHGRITSMGRMDRVPYTLLQRLADLNSASSGAMALAEAASGGGVNILAPYWSDNGAGTEFRANVRNALTRGFTGKGDTRGINLDDWNGTAIKTMLEGDATQPAHPSFIKLRTDADAANLARQRSYFDKWIRTAPNELKFGDRVISPDEMFDAFTSQKFNFDDALGMLKDKDKMAALRTASEESAAKNIKMVREAHKTLADDMFKTVAKNVGKQRWRAAGRLALPAALLGGGGLALADSFGLGKSAPSTPSRIAPKAIGEIDNLVDQIKGIRF